MYLCWKCGMETKDDEKECSYCGAKKVEGKVITNEQQMQQQYVRRKIQKEHIIVALMLAALIFLAFMITNG